jgi:hypothetical protein
LQRYAQVQVDLAILHATGLAAERPPNGTRR